MLLATNEVNSVENNKSITKFVKPKSGKVLEIGKLSKSQKSDKSEKKLSKNVNSLIFSTNRVKPNLLTSGVKKAFNYLRLAFTKASFL